MNESRIAGGIIILLSLVLVVGGFISSSTNRQLKKQNEELSSKIEKLELLNDKTESESGKDKMKDTSVDSEKTEEASSNQGAKNFQELQSLNSFNEDFVNHLNTNDDVKVNNEYLKSLTNESAQNYLVQQSYIFENGLETEENTSTEDKHHHSESHSTTDVSVSTSDIKSYFNVVDDNSYEGVTTYKVNSNVNGKVTTGNFIMKAYYMKDNGTWKVNSIDAISPVSDPNADPIFKTQ